MKLAAVILNYNDAEGTVAAIKRISGFSCFADIIAVDNASTDDSAEIIQSALGEMHDARLHFIEADKNGGYGSGNNLGVRYACDKLGAGLTLIANPDALFSEALVENMRELFEQDEAAAVVGAVMRKGRGCESFRYEEYISSGWMRRNTLQCLLNSGPISRRIFRNYINYPESYYMKADCIEDAVSVYAVHGSLLMVSTARFVEVGGYDEEMFLYGEENVLAEKMYQKGYKTYLLKQGYEHAGSVSITGSGLKAVRRQKLRSSSENYYYRKYLNCDESGMNIVGLFQKAVLAETRIAEKLHLL